MMFPKMKPARDTPYLRWLAGCCCCVPGCNYAPCEAAHVGRTGKGIAAKCSDHEAVPMCFRHHHKYHTRGHLWFANEYRVDYGSLVRKYRKVYDQFDHDGWMTSSSNHIKSYRPRRRA